MNNFFDQAFNFLLEDEGTTYTNNPADSGGPTKFGVSQRAYEIYVGQPVHPAVIENLYRDDAARFYYDTYWKTLNCDKMNKLGVAVCMFDSSVLYGLGTASRIAQLALNMCGKVLKVDCLFGDESLAMLNETDQEEFLNAFHSLILQRIDSIIAANPKNEVFRKGWTMRADRILTMNNLNPLINSIT
jgi:lysozyme family protein